MRGIFYFRSIQKLASAAKVHSAMSRTHSAV
jgi:hypothetical protein